MPAEKGARLIADEIVREAREKASEIFEAVRREAKTILDAARFGVKEKEEQLMAEARVRGKSIYEEMLAEGRMRAKKEVLRRREELLNEVFEEAEKELRAYAASKGYESDLIKITVDACKRLGSGSVVICANKRDLGLLKRREEELSREAGAAVSFGEPIPTIGGVKVRALDGTIEVDSTLEGKMKRDFEVLRVRVAKLLFEGSR